MGFVVILFMIGIFLMVSPMAGELSDIADLIRHNAEPTDLTGGYTGRSRTSTTLRETRRTVKDGEMHEIVREAELPCNE